MPQMFFSVATDALRDYTDIVVTAVGLVDRTAQSGTAPIRLIPGGLHQAARDAHALPQIERRILAHADETVRHRSRGAPIVVRDPQVEKLLGTSAYTTEAIEAMERQQQEREAREPDSKTSVSPAAKKPRGGQARKCEPGPAGRLVSGICS